VIALCLFYCAVLILYVFDLLLTFQLHILYLVQVAYKLKMQ